LIRQDRGRDFASWCILLNKFEQDVRSADELILINDSFYCTAPDLSGFFAEFRASETDAFGITESRQQEPHLQSSILMFSKKFINTKEFWDFVRTYPFPEAKDEVIECGEFGISRVVMKSGLRWRAMLALEYACDCWLAKIEQSDLPDNAKSAIVRSFHNSVADDFDINPQHMFWRLILTTCRLPLIKRELVNLNPAGIHDIADAENEVRALFGDAAAAAFILEAQRNKA